MQIYILHFLNLSRNLINDVISKVQPCVFELNFELPKRVASHFQSLICG